MLRKWIVLTAVAFGAPTDALAQVQSGRGVESGVRSGFD